MFFIVLKIFLFTTFLRICDSNVEFVKRLSVIHEVVTENEGQCFKDLKEVLNLVMLEDLGAIQSEFCDVRNFLEKK